MKNRSSISGRACESLARTLVLIALMLLPGLAAAQVQSQAPVADTTIDAVIASREVESVLLTEDRQRYEELAVRRVANAARLQEVRRALDGWIPVENPASAGRLGQLIARLETLEGERSELLVTERLLLRQIRDRLRRIELFEEQLELLRGRERPETGLLSGRWDIVLLPINQRGKCALSQSGTIVGGTYTLSGGFNGSFRGTLVQNKVYLERIDSKLGKVMELEGRVAVDGNRIRGTWVSYDLAEGVGGTGQWTAVRITDEQP